MERTEGVPNRFDYYLRVSSSSLWCLLSLLLTNNLSLSSSLPLFSFDFSFDFSFVFVFVLRLLLRLRSSSSSSYSSSALYTIHTPHTHTAYIQNEYDVDFIDINMGCPIDGVCNKGAGAGLMQRPSKVKDIVEVLLRVMTIPLTLKMRTGWNQNHPTGHKLIPQIQGWSHDISSRFGVHAVAGLTMHGRSRLQRCVLYGCGSYGCEGGTVRRL